MVDKSVALMNETDYDDLAVISNGLSFMSGLASTAPKQPLMFQTAVMDVGQSGTVGRGMAWLSALEISVVLTVASAWMLNW